MLTAVFFTAYIMLIAMWEELAGKVGHRDQLIICKPRLSESALYCCVRCGDLRSPWVTERRWPLAFCPRRYPPSGASDYAMTTTIMTNSIVLRAPFMSTVRID